LTNEPPTIADHAEFRRLLRAGHGRIITFLQTHASAPYHDIILETCLHNPAYDQQSEGTRGRYMIDLLRATHNLSTYRRTILDALHISVGNEDADKGDDEHLCSIARWLAEEGDQEAREVLYAFVTAKLQDGEYTGSDTLVALDGIEGFTYVVTLIDQSTHTSTDSEIFYGGWFTYILQDFYGEEQAAALLQEAATQNESIAAYLQMVAWNDARDERNRNNRAVRPYEDYTVLQAFIDNPKEMRGRLARWGRSATEKDLVRAAEDLLNSQNDERLVKYLRVFQARSFPLDPQRLLALNEHPDETFVKAVYNALRRVQHPAVRAHALQLFAASQRLADAIDLLRSNFKEGDQSLIERALRKPLTDENIHSIGMSMLDIIKKRTRDEDTNILLLLYEQEPCSFCRESVVNALIERDRVPEWMIAECRYDANTDIRAMIEEKYGDADHLPEHREL
jgi:hypothetical protein